MNYKVLIVALCFFSLCGSLLATARVSAGTDASVVAGNLPGTGAPAAELLAQSRAKYAALKSYADTGTVTTEIKLAGAPSLIENHSFTTAYRGPRQFFFSFTEDPAAGGERFVIWCPGEAFHTWWSTTKVHETYERGRGSLAFALAPPFTQGAALKIAPLLFAASGLKGTLTAFQEAKMVGKEEISGHSCHKLSGVARFSYENGLGQEARPTTVWIDAETLLVRKVIEDTSSAGTTSFITTTFEPQANPELAESRFRFAVPKE